MTPSIARADITQVYRTIAPYIRETPVLRIRGDDVGLPHPVSITLKLEQLQRAGSFKARGAFANLLLREMPAAGVIAASGGNHGAAVAYAAQRLGHRARIFVPSVASPAKVERIRACGADLCISGERYADALAASAACAAESGALPVHAFDQRETVLGQGTLGLELESQAELDTLLVPVGGGGLVAGIAAWYAGRIRIVGVEPREAPTLTEALKAGRPIDAPAGGIAADSLAPRRVGALVFPIARAYVDRVVLVGDADIRNAQQVLWDAARLAVEPGGAAAFAALLSGGYLAGPTERVGVVISGGNTADVTFERA
jgi:threonine dehydratase